MSAKSQDMTWSAYMAVLRRRWRPTALTAGLVAAIGIYITFALPAMYQSSALILIEQQNLPEEYVKTTVNSYLDERLQAIHEVVTAPPNVLDLIQRLDLYPDERAEGMHEDDLIAMFQDNATMVVQNITTVDPQTRREVVVDYAFRIAFSYPDPVVAKNVADELSGMYVKQNQVIRMESAARTTSFLDAQAADLRKRLADVTERIAQFKSQHPNNLPEDQAVNLEMLTRAREDLTKAEDRLRETQERKAILESELAETPRYRPVLTESGEPMLGAVDRLTQAQQELIQLRGRYNDNHPAIQNLLREISALSQSPTNQQNLAEQIRTELAAKERELAAARQIYNDNHPDVVTLRRTIDSLEQQLADAGANMARTGNSQPLPPNNPVYQQLQARIRTAEKELADYNTIRETLTATIAEIEARRLASPEVERQYAALTQEQNLLLEQYSELRNLGSQADLAQSLEMGDSSERLTVISPPRIPAEPVSPNRVSLSLLVTVLSIALGLGVASLTEAADTTVRGQHDIQQILEVPPMGIIPYVEDRRERLRRLAINASMGVAAVGAVAIILVTALV